MNSATPRFWGRGHNVVVEGEPRALVIGSGYAGVKHAEALDELGIPYSGPVSARRAMEDPHALDDPALSVVHVCAANDLHVGLASRALRAGKDVICEKPLAVDVPGAEELVAVARQTGRLAVLAYNYRFHPLVIELAARVAFLGPLHTARGSFLQDWLLLATDANWRVEEARGGASRAIADIGAHWLDLAEVVSGRHIVAVAAQLGRLHGRGTEDHAGLLLRFSDGMTGNLMLSQAAAGHRNDMELSLDGATGSATWRHERPDELWLGSRGGDALVVRREDELLSPVARELATLPAGSNEARRNLLAAVYARLAGDKRTPAAPLPTFEDGLRHARFAAGALESASRERWVSIA
jgi:predicted dehydrogenase